MWLISILVVVLVFSFIFYNSFKSKRKIKARFKILISCLHQLDKNLKIEQESFESIDLFTANNRGSLSIFLNQYKGLLYVIIESVNGENHNDKKEWFFIDERNQNLIFEEIATTFFLETESILTSRKIKQITYKSVENTKQIPLTTIFSQKNLAQATFCIAFANASRFSKNNTVNIKSNFEILLFSCVVCFQKINNSKRNYEWSEYLKFLVNYLENINLSHQIKELDLYFNTRFELFSEQLDLIKSETNPDFDALHHNFFIKPLQNKKKYKVSENWSTVHFANAVLLLIVDIETKIDVLVSISV